MTVANLMTAARHGGWASAAGYLGSRVTISAAPEELLRCVLSELIELNTALVVRRLGPLDGTERFTLEIRADESTVDIDRVDPPVRAAVRALLAAMNGHADDAAEQIDLTLVAGRAAAVDAVMVAAGWTLDQLDWCRHHDVPAPEWIAAP